MADSSFLIRETKNHAAQLLKLHDEGDGTYSWQVYGVVGDGGGSLTVDGPLTDAELRATAVPVSDGSGSLTVDGPLTDTQLRATAVPVSDASGALTVDNGGTFAVQAAQSGVWSAKFVDENGTAYGVKHISNKLRVSSMPYLYDIAEGNVAGHDPFTKVGFNADVDNAEEDIWEPGGLYVWPSAAMQMSVKSTDNTNDTAGGTGVLKVKIYYLDNTYAAQTEEVTLAGTTWVDTAATNILRVNAFRASDTGTGKAAAGTITIADKATRAIVYAQISTGYTSSRQAIYTVPLGKTFYLTSMTISAASATASQFTRTTLRTTYDDLAGAIGDCFYAHAEVVVGSFTIQRNFELPEKIVATTDVKVSSIGNAANSNVNMSVALRGWLE